MEFIWKTHNGGFLKPLEYVRATNNEPCLQNSKTSAVQRSFDGLYNLILVRIVYSIYIRVWCTFGKFKRKENIASLRKMTDGGKKTRRL